MPRKPEPSFRLKEIIWDLAATTGAENLSALQKDLDYRLEKLRKDKNGDFSEDTPDIRTIRRIIKSDINRLAPEIIAAKLPPYVWHLRYDYEEIKQLAKGSIEPKREPPTEAAVEQGTSHEQKMREQDERLAGEKQAAQYSLTQEAHFDEVKKYKETWEGKLSGWSWNRLSDALAFGRQIPRLKDLEDTDWFAKVRNHLTEPKLWGWWEELKEAVTSIEDEVDSLWKQMLDQAQETGLQLIPSLEEKEPQEGITADFFRLLVYEQEYRAIGEPSYYPGSRIYREDSVTDTSVEEGLACLSGEQPKKLLPTMLVSGGAKVTSEDARVVEMLATPVKRPVAVCFFIRFANQEIAFVEDTVRLPKVQEIHEACRKKYGQKLKELMDKSEGPRNLIRPFVDQLRATEISRELHPCCPDFGRWIGRGRYAEEALRDEAYAKCTKGDHSWFDDKRFNGMGYWSESSPEFGSFGKIEARYSTKTCYFCGHSQTSL